MKKAVLTLTFCFASVQVYGNVLRSKKSFEINKVSSLLSLVAGAIVVSQAKKSAVASQVNKSTAKLILDVAEKEE